MILCALLNLLIRQNTRGVCIRLAMILLPADPVASGPNKSRGFCLFIWFSFFLFFSLHPFANLKQDIKSSIIWLQVPIWPHPTLCPHVSSQHVSLITAQLMKLSSWLIQLWPVNCKYQLYWNKDAIKVNSKTLLSLLCWRVMRREDLHRS